MRLQLTRAAIAFAVAFVASGAGTASAQPPPEHQREAPGPEPERASDETPPSSPSNIDVHASSEIAGYADTNHVFVFSPTIAGTVSNPTAGWAVGGRYLVDVVSAASVDIVSTASRRWEEVRHAGSVDATYKPGEFGVSGTAAVSIEPDYQSYTGGGSVSHDFFTKNLTLLAGFSHGHDIAGRTDTPFSVFSRKLDIEDFKAGGSVVLDRSTILALVADVILENGDPSKPYRYVPLFAPGTVVPKGASIDYVNSVRTSARALEQLPLTRDRLAITVRMAHRFATSTLRLDERLYHDSWGMSATSSDARIVFDVGRFELGPHVRFHAQAPVDFWQRAYVLRPGFDFPAIRTGDRELGPLVNLTGGGTLRWLLGPAGDPRRWTLGLDLGATHTWYLDDLYITSRLATVGALSLEANL